MTNTPPNLRVAKTCSNCMSWVADDCTKYPPDYEDPNVFALIDGNICDDWTPDAIVSGYMSVLGIDVLSPYEANRSTGE